MSGTISSVRDRVGSAVAVAGIVLLVAGVATAVIVRVLMTASAIPAPMATLSVGAYTGYAFPLKPHDTSNETLIAVAFAAAAIGLLALVVGVALRATRRRGH